MSQIHLTQDRAENTSLYRSGFCLQDLNWLRRNLVVIATRTNGI
ncbi:hypothetical protein [Kovacikia minuta]|nr:hypothetical protein [Kovacikia minuta]